MINGATMRSRLEAAFDRFVDVRSIGDRAAANLLRDLEVDIAVDLTGFTRDARSGILALRPAPVQVNYLGFPGTMGADYMDYIIADRFVIPVEHQAYYAEKVVYLPDTYQANSSTRPLGERALTRADMGLPDNALVFCSFSSSYKITPAMFQIWMRLLRSFEGSVLWLLGGNAGVERNLRREAADRGIAPDRLVFAPRAGYSDYLARYQFADLFLDTLPFNAGTTASDALWAGLPLVTCAGEAFASRMAGSLLNAVGLPELVTHNLEDYEALALKLASDSNMLAGVKARLAANRATYPLFDSGRFRRHIEAAYKMMWDIYQRGEQPAPLAIEPDKEKAFRPV
jgi:protein O-GlcNAc transferase